MAERGTGLLIWSDPWYLASPPPCLALGPSKRVWCPFSTVPAKEVRRGWHAAFREDSKEGSEASCLPKATQMQPTSGLGNQLPRCPLSGQDPLLSGFTLPMPCKLRALGFTLTVTCILFLQPWRNQAHKAAGMVTGLWWVLLPRSLSSREYRGPQSPEH